MLSLFMDVAVMRHGPTHTVLHRALSEATPNGGPGMIAIDPANEAGIGGSFGDFPQRLSFCPPIGRLFFEKIYSNTGRVAPAPLDAGPGVTIMLGKPPVELLQQILGRFG
jgi:hypothetical protein